MNKILQSANFYFVLALLFFVLTFYLGSMMDKERYTDCYDNYNNKIVGVSCIENYSDFPLAKYYPLCGLISISFTFIGLLFSTIIWED